MLRFPAPDRAAPNSTQPVAHTLLCCLDTSKFLWQRLGDWSSVLLFEIDLHALEAEFVRRDDVVDDDSLGHFPEELSGIELVVRSGSGNDLGLILDGKVLVGVGRVDVFGIQIQDLVVGNNTGVGKVVDSGQTLLGHSQRCWEHFAQDGHRVGDVYDAFVLDDFGNETAVDEIVRNRHANSQDHAVGVVLQHGFHVPLGFTVKGSIEVGSVFLGETDSGSLGVFLVVYEDASGGVNGAVDSPLQAKIGEIQGSDDIGSNSFGLVDFAPIDVGTSGDSGGVQNVGGLHFVQFLGDGFTVLQSAAGGQDLDSLWVLNESFEIQSITTTCVRFE